MSSAPVQVLLELTTECNMQCKHCLVGTNRAQLDELDCKNILRILDELYDMGVFQVNLTGGEPFLRKDIFNILRHLIDFGETQEFSLLTNCTLLNHDDVKELSKIVKHQENLSLQISLDGFSPEIYNNLRVGDAYLFNKVITSIKELVQNNVCVNTCFTITNLNADYALKTAKFAIEDLGVNSIHFIHLFPSGRAIKSHKHLQPPLDVWGKFLMQVTEIRRNNTWGEHSNRISVGFFNFYEFVIALLSQGADIDILKDWGFSNHLFRRKVKKKYIFCDAGYEDLCIASNGDVYPCMPSRGVGFKAGNMQKNSLHEIWTNSDVLRWFRRRNWDIKGFCRQCPFLDICGGGCRVNAYALKGNKNASDPCCPISSGQLEIDKEWINLLKQFSALESMITVQK